MGHKRKKHQSSGTSSDSDSDSDSSIELRNRKKKKRGKEYSSSDDDSRKKKKKRKHKDRREKRKKKDRKMKKLRKHDDDEEDFDEEDTKKKKKRTSQEKLQVTMDAREQEKCLIYQNAELAKARLNGELRDVQARQAKMQDMYGTVDWRARKKLRLEKKKLERSVAAGKRLAQIEEEESARMDAFRVALGLPTAEAQRQAEWRAEATRALASQDAPNIPSKPQKKTIIGPKLPR